MNTRKTWLLLACFLPWAGLRAATAGQPPLPVEIADTFTYLMLNEEVSYFTASAEDSLALDSILRLSDQSFLPAHRRGFFFGLEGDEYWVKFVIKTTAAYTKKADFILEIVNPYIQAANFYLLHDDVPVKAERLGVYPSFAAGRPAEHLHRNWQIPFKLEIKDSLVCLLHIPPGPSPLQFDLYLWEKSYRHQQQELENIVLVSYFLILLVYLTLIFLVNRVARFRSLWFYFTYVGLGALLAFSDLGLGYQHLWPHQPTWHQAANLVISNLYLIAGLQFVRAYFDTPGFFPLLNRIIILVMGIAAAFIPFALLHPHTPLRFSHILHGLHYLAFLTGFASAIIVFVMSIVKGQRVLAGWFLFGFSLHGLGILLTLLQYINWFPVISSTHWFNAWKTPLAFYPQLAMMAGALIEVPVLFYVAFSRFRTLYDDAHQQARLREDNLSDLVMSIEQERRRLGQDLHDTLGVQMAAIKMKLSMLHEKITDGQRRELGQAIRDLDHTYQEMRAISQDLMPPSLERQGLAAAIASLLSRIKASAPGLKTHFYYNAPLEQLSPQARLHLYRILLELITNTLKHSEAQELSVQLTRYDGRLLLTVEDDGQGFDAQTRPDGIGLKNVAYRVKALHGAMELDSQPGRGTTVAIDFPMDRVMGAQ